VTVNVAVAVFACSSVAEHVTVVAPIGKVDADAGVQADAATKSSGSLNVTEYGTWAPEGPVASTATSATVITGGVSSRTWTTRLTVTGNLVVRAFPRVSLELQATVVVPIGKTAPDAGTHATGRSPSTRSWAEDAWVTGVPAGFELATVMPAGVAIDGGLVSTTVTVNDRALVCPCSSVAVHCTVVVPSGKVVAGAGAQLELATASSGSVTVTV